MHRLPIRHHANQARSRQASAELQAFNMRQVTHSNAVPPKRGLSNAHRRNVAESQKCQVITIPEIAKYGQINKTKFSTQLNVSLSIKLIKIMRSHSPVSACSYTISASLSSTCREPCVGECYKSKI